MRFHDVVALTGAVGLVAGALVLVFLPGFRWAGGLTALAGLIVLAYGASFL